MTRLLLVEDNEMNRNMLGRRLQRRDYEVFFAADGLEAIEAAHHCSPELILMDMSLPQVDGWEASRRLKADEHTSHIPVIALTAHALQGDREQAIEAGCDEYETKPIDFERLLHKIDDLIELADGLR